MKALDRVKNRKVQLTTSVVAVGAVLQSGVIEQNIADIMEHWEAIVAIAAMMYNALLTFFGKGHTEEPAVK